ncbi:MAG: serine/threonine protein kinase, partial [Desulfurococcales archaeon]|nr:serine/threonine protein kinase [Desulfurococcales archaeon]
LNSLTRRGYLLGIGDRIGVGKESDVYLGESPSGTVVVKLHREGRTSFSKVRRFRVYAREIEGEDWIRVVKTIGEREFKALVELKANGALVPEPIAYNRHAVVQEYIRGMDLYKVDDMEEEVARRSLGDIVETLRIAYTKVGIVHADLSQYNVLVSEEGRGYVIDWPQYVYKGEEVSEELLARDVKYITSYYERKFGIGVDPGAVLKYVKGEIDEKPL